MNALLKRRLWATARVLIAVAILTLLASNGHLDWPRLRGLLRAWPLTLAALCLLLVAFAMASWRFCILAAPSGLAISLGRSMRLTLIGNAANFVIPTVGSDLIRLWFTAGNRALDRTRIGTIVLLDRVLGLLGLLLLPLALAPFFWSVVRANPVIQGLLVIAAGGSCVLAAGVLVALSRRGIASAPIQFALRVAPLGGYPARILDTIHNYRFRGGVLVAAVAWSLAANLCAAGCIVCLQLATLPGSQGPLGGFLTSLVFVLNNVPITPGGIGFTETAAASLYRLAGLEGGAETMLGMRLLFLVLTPVGVLLYLIDSRAREASMRASESATADHATATQATPSKSADFV